jgi:hypothetical protein
LWFSLAPHALAAGALVSGLIFYAAFRMRRLKGYRFAMFGAMLAVFTGLVLGPLFGLWALVVLLRRKVCAAFDEGRSRSRLLALALSGCCF